MNTNKQLNYYSYNRPHTFMLISKKILPWLLFLMLTFFFAGVYLGLIRGPSDFQQGDFFKIIYIHLPLAWLSLLNYTGLTVCSIGYLLTKNPIFSLQAKALAESGCMFTFITLLSGSLWGAPTWGTYWVWDARLTSMLLLLLIYITYIILTTDNNNKTATTNAIIAIFGFINIPIIKYSVDWWTTLHQPASITFTKIAVDISMITPILLFSIAFINYTLYLLLLIIRQNLTLYKTHNIIRLKT